MKKKLLALAVATAIAGTTMLGVTSAYEVTYHPEANVSYTLNSGFDTSGEFTAGLITITDGTETYTIMDRNLGATKSGSTCSSSDLGACGYYFQWGNNYGFPTARSVATSSTQVDASGYGPGNYYSSSTFITRSSSPLDRSSVKNDNLRGGEDGTYEAMQGPCPEGYHVPSSGEWLGLLTMLGYDGTYNSVASKQAINSLLNELYLPFAGRRYFASAGVNSQGTYAYYWSSTAYIAEYAYLLYFNSAGLYPQNGSDRADGFSVRCFKNSSYSTSNLSCEEGETYYPELGVCATKGENGIYYSRDADENNDITICDPSSNGTKCITMQDKNLGATKAGTGCSASDTGACGFHFQWGNNHGFEIGCRTNGCSDTVTKSATSTLAIWSPDYNHVGYNGTTFIKVTSSPYDYWRDKTPSNHNGLRGGENDTAEYNYGFDETNNVATKVGNRRGPCGEGYHVPSIGERGTLLKYWAANYTGAGNTLILSYSNSSGLPKFSSNATAAVQFQDDFKIPFAGIRGEGAAMVAAIGDYACLWSSSPFIGNYYARKIYLNPTEAYADVYSFRASALPLRCFKDSYLSFPSGEEECPDGTHTEGDECVANYSTTGCSIYSTPANATSITGNVDITRNGSGWSEPEPCAWYCNAGYHRVGDECVVNYQQTGCSIYSTPANATSITRNVDITWNGSGWSEPEACDWYCNAGYHRVGDECVVNYQQTGCAQTGKPENSVYNIVNVLGVWNSGTNSWDTPACSWHCDEHYHTGANGNTCDIDTFTVTFEDPSGENTDIVWTGEYNLETSGNVDFPLWVRNGYTLSWSREIPDVVPAENTVITAIWTKKQSGGNGGGGGGSSLKKDNCPDGDYSDSYYDGTCGKKKVIEDSLAMPQNDGKGSEDSPTKPQNGKTGHNSADEVVYDTLKFNPHYSDDMNKAYQFAYHYGITTKTNIKDAAMNWELTRIAMAKMLSQYAINVLGIQPDQSRNNQFADVSDNLDTEYDDGVTLAYQLGIMGINMPNNEFRPYGYVTRAEFATALSRLLYHTSDGMFEKTSRYYVPHINKLAYEGILTNTDPTMKELRGYVMLMLMRSAK